jgi:hypothetical protein
MLNWLGEIYSKPKYFQIHYYMNYDDFPILNNEAYNLINAEYTKQNTCNRNQHIYKIFTLISKCESFSIPKSLNIKIKTIINNLLKILGNIKENLKTIENNANFSLKNTINFNLFEFLNIFLNILLEFILWKSTEHKDYILSIITNGELSIARELISSIEVLKSLNITIFTYM